MTQEAFQESSVKELGRLEAQLASLRQELAALTLKQNSVADEVGLLPQKIQAARADVSGKYPEPCGTSFPLRPPTGDGVREGECQLEHCPGLFFWRDIHSWTDAGLSSVGMLPVPGHCSLGCSSQPLTSLLGSLSFLPFHLCSLPQRQPTYPTIAAPAAIASSF